MIDWDTFKAQLQTNPGKLLKSVLLLAGCFLVIWILVVVQSDTSMQNNVRLQESGRLDSLRITSEQAEATPSNEPGQSLSGTASESDSFSPLPAVIFALVALAGIWLWIRSRNHSSGNTANGTVFTTVGSQQLPGGQQLVVIQINSEYWVMTTGGTQGMNLLHRYPADEWDGLPSQPKKANWTNTFLDSLNSAATQQKKAG